MRRLNERQRDVLVWIADGCPERAWPDFTYRGTARALQGRGLVILRGRGATWTASVTPAGRALLDGGTELRGPATPPKRQNTRHAAPSRSQAPMVSGEGLLQQLVANGGRLIVDDPDDVVRGAYRRALAAVPRDRVPAAKRIKHRGRDRGDLVIELVDAPPERPALVPVPIPKRVDVEHPVVRHLMENENALDVSAPCRERALRLVQALASECDRRGHNVRHRGTEPGIEVVIGGRAIALQINELRERTFRFPEDEIAAAKYPWQRVSPVLDWRGTGSLEIRYQPAYYTSKRWSDGKRWAVESRLSKLLVWAEGLAGT